MISKLDEDREFKGHHHEAVRFRNPRRSQSVQSRRPSRRGDRVYRRRNTGGTRVANQPIPTQRGNYTCGTPVPISRFEVLKMKFIGPDMPSPLPPVQPPSPPRPSPSPLPGHPPPGPVSEPPLQGQS